MILPLFYKDVYEFDLSIPDFIFESIRTTISTHSHLGFSEINMVVYSIGLVSEEALGAHDFTSYEL